MFDEFESTESENERPFTDVLTALFTDKDVPISLIYRLSDLSDEESAELNSRWDTVADERRRVIARHMADIAEENFVVDFSRVFGHFLRDAYAPVRAAALEGLWDSTDLQLIEPIISLMQSDPEHEVRSAAAGALAHYVLMSEWGELPEHISPRVAQALLAVYADPHADARVKRAALESVSGGSLPQIKRIIGEAYESGDLEMQLSAMFAMGRSADAHWVPILIDEMENPWSAARAEAARAAGMIGSDEASSALGELVYDADEDVALTAIEALGRIGGDEATRILMALVEDPDMEELADAVEDALQETAWIQHDLELLDMMPDAFGAGGEFDDEEWFDDEDELG